MGVSRAFFGWDLTPECASANPIGDHLEELFRIGGIMRKVRRLSLFGVGSLAVILICMIGIPGSQANKAAGIKMLDYFHTTKGVAPTGSLTLWGVYLYGMTSAGGTANLGTIFKFDTQNNAETVIHSFGKTATDGFQPYGSLIHSGTILYGTTYQGGVNQGGTIFKLNTTTNVETVLYNFAGGTTDGAGPYGSLILSGTTLYGMTQYGGASLQGTIFSFDTATNVETVLHSFAGYPFDGASPTGSLTLLGTILYGMTPHGGVANVGTIFSFDTVANVETVLHSFLGGASDGSGPTGSLTLSGTILYGMTQHGGVGVDSPGTIFEFDTVANVETVLHSFEGSSTDGSSPYGDLTLSGTTLYGMTYQGGSKLGGPPFDGLGTIFMFDTDTKVQTILHNFAGGTTDGDRPYGSLTLSVSGTTLYGMTNQGGTYNAGTLFSIPSVPPLTISGTVTKSGSTPLAGVTVTLSQPGWTETQTTTSSGAYSFSDLAPGSYTVTPSYHGFTFTPASQSVPLTASDVTGVNFTGAPVALPAR
jgi:uncharacterized repeat protein (TIGR03803 family)